MRLAAVAILAGYLALALGMSVSILITKEVISHGAQEMNPLMAWVFQRGPLTVEISIVTTWAGLFLLGVVGAKAYSAYASTGEPSARLMCRVSVLGLVSLAVIHGVDLYHDIWVLHTIGLSP